MSSHPAPQWFIDAMAVPLQRRVLEQAGCKLNYFVWGDPAKPPILLVHGGAAHAMWWSALAPQLALHYYVVAQDLSGHGDSGRRDAYPLEGWADEVMAVAQDAGCVGLPILVGHSMGGLVSIVAAAIHGHRLAGAVIVDSPVRKPDPESNEAQSIRTGKPRWRVAIQITPTGSAGPESLDRASPSYGHPGKLSSRLATATQPEMTPPHPEFS